MNRSSGTLARKALCLLMILASVLVFDGIADRFVTEEASAVRPVMAVIEFDPSGAYQKGNLVTVRSGPPVADGQGKIEPTSMAIVEGKVTVFKVARLARQKIVINLRSRTSDPDLMVGIPNPPIVEISAIAKIATVRFNVSVRISTPMLPYTTANDQLKRVEVYGTWENLQQAGLPREGGDIDPHPFFVQIKPFYQMQLTSDPPFVRMLPGQTREIDLIVINYGNAYDRYDISVPYEGRLADRGWVITFNRTSLVVPPMSEGYVKVKITSPRKFSTIYHTGVNQFPVAAESYNTRVLVERGELLTVEQEETLIQVTTPGPDLLYIPMIWALLLYVLLAVILFNFGINIVNLRRRKLLLPEGADPGFVALARSLSSRRGPGTRAPRVRPARGPGKGSLGGPGGPGGGWAGMRSGRPGPVLDLEAKRKPGKERDDLDLSDLDLGPAQESRTSKGFGSGPARPFAAPARKEGTPRRPLSDVLEDL